MAKLILSLDGMVLREYPLTKERTTIGRKPHNDVVIDNLAVSGEHAMIMTILNDSFLEDLGSTNGTLVNGQPIKKHFLQNSDVIELGKYKIRYHSEVAAAQPAQPDFEKTMVLRASPASTPSAPAPAAAAAAAPAPAVAPAAKSLRDTVVDPAQADGLASTDLGAKPAPAPEPAAEVTAVAAPVAAPVAAAPVPPAAAPRPAPAAMSTVVATAAAMAGGAAAVEAPPPAVAAVQAGNAAPATVGVIQILSGPSAGKELQLTKALTTLGKPGVQVAVIARRPQGYFITHVEGSHFPVVNGRSLDAQAHALGDHDVVELAGVKMEFFLKPGV